jgi:hypothetical protein
VPVAILHTQETKQKTTGKENKKDIGYALKENTERRNTDTPIHRYVEMIMQPIHRRLVSSG